MAGLINLIKEGYFDKEDKLVSLHTGGIAVLFADKLQSRETPATPVVE